MNDQYNNKISLRLARKDDFQSVLELSQGIFNGGDYIPVVFHDWLKTKNKFMYVAELQGKVVGLNVATVVSDGKTLLTQAFRIHPEYQGQRLSYQIILGVIDNIRQMYPQLCKNHYLSQNSKMLKIANRLGYKQIIEKLNYFEVDIKPNVDLLPLIGYRCQMLNENGQNLFFYDQSDAAVIVTSKNALDIIAPQRMMLRDWEPYEAIPSNIKHIFQENDKMFADVSTEELKQGKIPKSFSNGCLAPRVGSVFWICSVYTNDLESFRAHVLRQLKSATEIIGKDFVFTPYVFSKISSREQKKVLEEELLSLKQSSIIESGSTRMFERVFKD